MNSPYEPPREAAARLEEAPAPAPESDVARKQMPVAAKVVAATIGVVSCITAALGLIYNLFTGYTVLVDIPAPAAQQGLSYFYPAFIIMSAVCIACYGLLLACGIDLVRLSLRSSRLLSLVLLFEVVYFFAIGSLWLQPTVGRSVAAATGLANGGMIVQFIILLPLWAPPALWWARSRCHSERLAD